MKQKRDVMMKAAAAVIEEGKERVLVRGGNMPL
jgi:hydroxymethylpyrimidine/phosphomethylpyrimidine kinase